MKSHQILVKPVAPRLPPKLEDWVGDVDSELMLQGSFIASQDLSDVEMLEIDDCVVENCSAPSVRLTACEVTDTRFKRLEGAGLRSRKTEWLRVEMFDSRLTGADFPEARLEDCVFKNVKFDDAGFRFTLFKRVSFENCVFTRTDFSHASFSHVSFSDCDLIDTNFQGANCATVDLSDEDLTSCKGILGLKGATISQQQLIQIAPMLAAELGFRVGAN